LSTSMSSVPWSRSPSFIALRRTAALLSTVETTTYGRVRVDVKRERRRA
jgi:hypothetical protein